MVFERVKENVVDLVKLSKVRMEEGKGILSCMYVGTVVGAWEHGREFRGK